jgi:hypothetical protein
MPRVRGCDAVTFKSRSAVTPITDDEFDWLLSTYQREAVHLETRDLYGTAVKLPHRSSWAGGDAADLAWLRQWCDTVGAAVRAGKSVRRARIVSEPLSEYQRWSFSVARPMIAAGEDIRWVPRRLVSSIAFPGNDFYLFDDRLTVFLIYAGNGLATERLVSSDPADIELCRASFEDVWKYAIPHSEYQPR